MDRYNPSKVIKCPKCGYQSNARTRKILYFPADVPLTVEDAERALPERVHVYCDECNFMIEAFHPMDYKEPENGSPPVE